MFHAISISMNKSQVAVNMCLKKCLILYMITEDSHPIVSTWVHIDMSAFHFFKPIHFAPWNFCWGLFTNDYEKKSVNLLMKSVGTPQHLSRSSLFVFNVLTRLYLLYRYFILFLISKHMIDYNQSNDIDNNQSRNWSIPDVINLLHPLE